MTKNLSQTPYEKNNRIFIYVIKKTIEPSCGLNEYAQKVWRKKSFYTDI